MAALAGMIGPLLLGGAIFGLTVLQYQFMRGLRWHPLWAPTTDWPSGLALGPYGALMVLSFLASGGLLAIFAAGLRQALGASSAFGGPTLLMLAGIAMALLAFKIDPSYAGTPRTYHGEIHDLAFGLLGVSLLLGLVALSRQFARDPRWQRHARHTLMTGLLVVPAFIFKGLLFYLFLANTLLWIELVALQLRQLARLLGKARGT